MVYPSDYKFEARKYTIKTTRVSNAIPFIVVIIVVIIVLIL